MKITAPPSLKKGDTIGITCPAGYMAADKADVCIHTLQSWGYEVMVGKTLGSESKTYFSGTDEERLDELQAMLDDSSINAILCGRGGYGMGRIVDRLDFKKFRKHPKWIIGYSDITILHGQLLKKHKISSLHSPMAAAFNDGGAIDPFVATLKNALEGRKISWEYPAHELNRKGKAEAPIVGGNLSLIVNGIGTNSDIDTDGKILFLEDVGEYIYSNDRMLVQLKRAGKLDKLAGLIVGGFTDMKDTERPFGSTIENEIANAVAEYDYPVAFGFPVSHTRENIAIRQGMPAKLSVTKTKTAYQQKG